jgi:hypothetical protein
MSREGRYDGPSLVQVAPTHVTEDEVVQVVRSYIEGLFPKTCPKCGRRFDSLLEYLQGTTHLGSPYLHEASADRDNTNPLGPIAHATCLCDNTLTIGSEGLPKPLLTELIAWARGDAERRSLTINELLRHLRDRIDSEVLGDDQPASRARRRLDRSEQA